MTLMICMKPCLIALAALLLTAGCVRDAYYVSAKERRYNVVSPFTPAKITTASWIDPQDHTSALYTSSTATMRSQRRSNLLGTLYIHHSDNPTDEPLTVHIRKEHRAYMAETPLSEPIKAGKYAITPHLSVGRHKDQKEMVGIVFRMPF